MSDDTISEVLNVLKEFRDRHDAIAASLQNSTELKDDLIKDETELLKIRVQDILRPEYVRRIVGKRKDVDRRKALQDTTKDLLERLAHNLQEESDEFKACEEGASNAESSVSRMSSALDPASPKHLLSWATGLLDNVSHHVSRLEKVGDLGIIALGGILGGCLNAVQSNAPRLFENEIWLSALLFGIAAAWVGVFVLLGTEKSDPLRRFAVGIVCGFAGVVVLEAAKSNVGIKGNDQAALQQNEDNIRGVITRSLEDVATSLKAMETLSEAPSEGQIVKLRHTLLTEISFVTASGSSDTNRYGYITTLRILDAITRWGAFFPDVALDSLEQIKKEEPAMNKRIMKQIDHDIGYIKERKEDLAKGNASAPAVSSKTIRDDSSALFPVNGSAMRSRPPKIFIHTPYWSCLGDEKRGFILAAFDGSATIAHQYQAQGAVTSTPSQTLVGYVRLANREKDAPSWSDFLFRSSNGEDVSDIISPLSNADDIAKALKDLKGKELIVKTNVVLRASFPALTSDGLVFARQSGVLNEGDKVKVIDTRMFTTTRIQFSQIWLKVEKLNVP